MVCLFCKKKRIEIKIRGPIFYFWKFPGQKKNNFIVSPFFSKKSGWLKVFAIILTFVSFFLGWSNCFVASIQNFHIFRKISRKKRSLAFWIATRSQSKPLMGGFESKNKNFRCCGTFLSQNSSWCTFSIDFLKKSIFHNFRFLNCWFVDFIGRILIYPVEYRPIGHIFRKYTLITLSTPICRR